MPPAITKCLNAGSSLGPSLRAAFSTSRIVCAGEQRMTSSAELLAALPESRSTSPPARFAPRPSSSTHRISSLVRDGKNTNGGGHDRLMGLVGKSESAKMRSMAASKAQIVAKNGESTAERMEKKELSDALTKQIKRRWKAGDVYAPHDLSWQEQEKWAKKTKTSVDVFDMINFNPLEHYRNFSVMSEYMTPMGRIMHRRETGLRPVNQRKIAKAIRRSIGMGMMPSVHKHPELLQKMAVKSLQHAPGGMSRRF